MTIKFRIARCRPKGPGWYLYFGPAMLAYLPTFAEVVSMYPAYLEAAKDGSLQSALRTIGYAV